MTRLFVLIGKDTEIQIDLTRRTTNGIDSDPRIQSREPSLEEIRTVISQIHDSLHRLSPSTHLIGNEPTPPLQ